MPKFSTKKRFFDSLLKKTLNLNALEKLLVYGKAELDSHNSETDEIKIELNDTNRPDLWSTAGLARQLRSVLGEKTTYSFFSNEDTHQKTEQRVIKVATDVRHVRPFIVGFEAYGVTINDVILKEIIHTQERLVWNYGCKRKTIAMGIYPAKKIIYPLHYRTCDPKTTQFIPLGMTSPLSLDDMLQKHPKGHEFGHLLQDFPAYPCLVDDNDTIFSMPPIINSADAGEVRVGDEHIFIELTGNSLAQLHTANNIVACDLADMGFTILPVLIEYQDAEQQPLSYTTPYNIHHTANYRADIKQICSLLGKTLTEQQIMDSISQLGMESEIVAHKTIKVNLPPWRNDYLHAVDIIEDVMIGTGIDQFTPLPATDFTIGQLLPIEHLSRKIVRVMIGLGFQEMIHNYLVADADFIQKMYSDEHRQTIEKKSVRVANPRSERHNMVRGSIIPSLLESCAISAHAVLPHQIFEIGKVVNADPKENYGSCTTQNIGIVHSATDARFTTINEQLSAIMYYIGTEYQITQTEDPRFIRGRVANICYNTQIIGILGELHPQVLENWHIDYPTTACEMNIEPLLTSKK